MCLIKVYPEKRSAENCFICLLDFNVGKVKICDPTFFFGEMTIQVRRYVGYLIHFDKEDTTSGFMFENLQTVDNCSF